jgi:hypothetical protein
MGQHQVRRLPVVDDKGRLCGILSLDDLARQARADAGMVAPPLRQAVGRTLGPHAATSSRTAGWPREVTLPGLPQIRTCTTRASGSSDYGFAGRRKREWTATAEGSG